MHARVVTRLDLHCGGSFAFEAAMISNSAGKNG